MAVARALDAGLPGLRLEAVASRRAQSASACCSRLSGAPRILTPRDIAHTCDVVVDCAPAAAFREIVEPALALGRTLLTLSGAALLRHPDLVDLAGRSDAAIVLASGAIGGLDALRAAAEGDLRSVELVSSKPPGSLAMSAYVREQGLDLSGLAVPLQLFAGSAGEGARLFPANANVVAALALAGIGPDATTYELWADPARMRNVHRLAVEADSARFTLEIECEPSEENPATSRLAALSLVASLRRLSAPLVVGS
ncbi:MAG: aspartate dehydrogenase [Phenylobacterium sp.]|nr:aspartate dehydrogenase [Phenylobacterium sp.]